MDRAKKPLLVQTASVPVFYKNFHCIAERCKDSCCVGWRIHFDKKDYLRLRRLEAPAALKEQLSKGIRRIRGQGADDKVYARFDLEGNEGRCPFWDQDGLCVIQRACGHEALPFVCTSYPRRSAYSPAVKQYSLSPSCEGVLEQLWDLPEGVKFIDEPLPKAEHRTASIPQQENLVPYYGAIHRTMIGILQNRALSLTERMLYLGITIQRLQKEDWSAFDLDRWSHQTAAMVGTDAIRETLEKITGNRTMYIVQNLKVLWLISKAKHEDWIDDIFEAMEVQEKIAFDADQNEEGNRKAHLQLNCALENYDEALAEFEQAFSEQEYFFENLMVASALYLDFPALSSKEALWKSYVSLCNLYSIFRFVTVLGCKGNEDRERLFHLIVMVSRATLHNRDRFQGFQEDLFQHESSTLAHMAILLRG